MDILIVGAGIAGLTLAAKLLQQGRRPVVIDRVSELHDEGYAILLYPLGSNVLHGLGKYEEAMASAQVGRTYEIVDGQGKLLQDVDLSALGSEIGPIALVTRSRLVEILYDAARGADFRFNNSVREISQTGGGKVSVQFTDGTSEAFDLVVACDGQNSHTRKLAFEAETDVFDPGWDLWVWWAELPNWTKGKYLESWGSGRFFGLYPAPGHVMCGAGIRKSHVSANAADIQQAKPFLKNLFSEMIQSNEVIDRAVDHAREIYVWPMRDVRASKWVNGRVCLLGDAAVGFLPTAGAGANTAMRCAASLADELSRVDGRIVPLALEVFEKRCRHMVEKNQDDSRMLAKMIFVDNKIISWGRDELVKHYPMTKFVKNIVDSMKMPF
ncbi:MAG: NAD(P)/FAD-dependent oxidoreductase [Pseudomonadota bacterium]